MPSFIYDVFSPVSSTTIDTMVLMLRALIGDLDSEDYTDEKLQTLLGASAKLVFAENYISGYTVIMDGSSLDITPDITDDLIALIVLKAACMLITSELKYRANIDGIRATCSDATISATAGSRVWDILFSDGPCKSYKEMKWEIEKAPLKSGAAFKAILSPFVNANYRGRGYCGGNS